MSEIREILNDLWNGRAPRVVRIRLTPAMLTKLIAGEMIEFKAGSARIEVLRETITPPKSCRTK